MADVPAVSRRTALRLLAMGVLGLLAACRPTRSPAATTTSGSTTAPAATGAPTPSVRGSQAAPTKADLAVQRAAGAEQALLLAYDAAAGQHPELADRLAPLRADHASHLVALTPGAPTTSPSPSPSPSPSATLGLGEPTNPVGSSSAPVGSAPASAGSASAGSSTTSASSAASDPLVVLAGLASLERQAAAARLDDLAATGGSLAMVLASIGGCEAAHAALLVPA